MNIKRLGVWLLSILMVAACTTGCGKDKTSSNSTESNAANSSASQEGNGNSTDSEDSSVGGSSENGEQEDTAIKEIDVNLTEADKQNMTPYSVTLSLLLDKTDANVNDYGVTWYVTDDTVNRANEGADFVQFVKKESGVTAENVSFENVEKIAAKRKTASGTIYFQAEAHNLEEGAKYFWRCGNSVKVYGEVSTLCVPTANRSQFTFMHASDSQNNNGVSPENYYHKALKFANAMADLDFIVHTGDMVQEAKEDALWKEMLSSDVLRKVPVMPISGNHDYWASHSSNDGINETFRHTNIKLPYQVTQTGIYYSFDYQNCHFIMLNVGDIDVGRWSKQIDWLKKDLEANKQKWTVLSIHEPFYSLGNYGQQTTAGHYHVDKIRAELTPVIEGKVDLVLQGHDHMVQYTYPLKSGAIQNSTATNVEREDGLGGKTTTKQYSLSGGTMYLMSGAAGNQNRNSNVQGDASQKALYAYYINNDESASAYRSKCASFSNITVTATDITVYTYGYLPEDASARLITSVSIVK